MRKRKSTRETKNMVQTALWLPRDMHEVLKKAGGERGLGEEIRRKLQIALEAADAALMPGDDTTSELLDQIKDIARDLSRGEPWYANRFTFDVFKAAVEALLLELQPRTEANPETKAHLQAAYRAEKPEDIGLLMARAAIIAFARERRGEAFLNAAKK